MTKKSKVKLKVVCPTCGQDMLEDPRNGKYGDCPQCGQGMNRKLTEQTKTERKALELISWFYECPVYADFTCVMDIERERWMRLARKWLRMEARLLESERDRLGLLHWPKDEAEHEARKALK